MNCADVGANGTGFLSEGENTLAPGVLVDAKYRVEKLIAVGGMAAVWSGRNVRTDKRVALKVILRSLSSKAEVMARFRREALAAGRIHHPNVVVVFDVVEHEGLTCMVMELLDGEPLIELYQRKGPLAEEEVVSLLLPAMRGVEAAHRQGVIHRDLKPHNIFVCRSPEGGVTNTKVLDFGVSKLKEDHPDPHAITVAGTMTGTPAYMAPEQVMGAQAVDPRTDVYAMGVVLFQGLAGRPPFEDPSYPALLVRIATEKAPSLSRIRPDLSEEMQRIIDRAIHKNPDERFPDMNAFIRALETWLKPSEPFERRLREIAPAEAMRPSQEALMVIPDLTAYAKPRRPWLGFAAGGVIGILCLLLWLLIQDDPLKGPPPAPSAGGIVPRPNLTIPPTQPGEAPSQPAQGQAQGQTNAGLAGVPPSPGGELPATAAGTAEAPQAAQGTPGLPGADGRDPNRGAGWSASEGSSPERSRHRSRHGSREGGERVADGTTPTSDKTTDKTDKATSDKTNAAGVEADKASDKSPVDKAAAKDPATQTTDTVPPLPKQLPGSTPRGPRAGSLSPEDF